MKQTKPSCRRMMQLPSSLVTAGVLMLLMTSPASNAAGLKLGDMCRLKGQETNTLQGLGLVVGLRGTGDADAAPTSRALARMMQLMGGPMAIDRGQPGCTLVAEADRQRVLQVGTARHRRVGVRRSQRREGGGDAMQLAVDLIECVPQL